MFDGYADSVILISPYPNRTGVSALKQVGVVIAPMQVRMEVAFNGRIFDKCN